MKKSVAAGAAAGVAAVALGIHISQRLRRRRDRDETTPPPEYSGSAEEWAARVELAACYRIIAKFAQADWGWTHCVYNHITVRLDTVDETHGPIFLINPLGARFDEVTPASLHTIDLNGNIVRRGASIPGVPDKGVLKAGFVIHSAIHSARHDIKAIFHTHHPDVVAVSSLKAGLLPCSLEACVALAVHSERRHPFEGVATDSDECARLIAALGPRALTVTLDNHGVVACGHTLPHALRNLWLYTKACTYQVRTLAAAGGDVERLLMPPKQVVDATIVREADNQANMDGLGETEFAAWTRGPAC